MAWHNDHTGLHAQILKQRGVHHSGINAVGAVPGQADARHAHPLADIAVLTQGGRAFHIRKAHSLESSKYRLRFDVSFMLLLGFVFPVLITGQAAIRSEILGLGKQCFHLRSVWRDPGSDKWRVFEAAAQYMSSDERRRMGAVVS